MDRDAWGSLMVLESARGQQRMNRVMCSTAAAGAGVLCGHTHIDTGLVERGGGGDGGEQMLGWWLPVVVVVGPFLTDRFGGMCGVCVCVCVWRVLRAWPPHMDTWGTPDQTAAGGYIHQQGCLGGGVMDACVCVWGGGWVSQTLALE